MEGRGRVLTSEHHTEGVGVCLFLPITRNVLVYWDFNKLCKLERSSQRVSLFAIPSMSCDT